ncbi:hypothetical protein Glove_510g36 [Diversispora epigaea]|uniref:Uncharacterized protein n=1 Tax=Diversispora epigaea TaxID=1348612 RepID=A0A397GJF6_9GLOM|nr:hypothetical protein Glove_510g36 [Diversispora epigaea]
MKIPILTSKKHKILTYNNIDYYLFYHPVLNCIKNILSISDISQNFTLKFENFKYKGEKAYSEQYTGNWWKNTEASLPHGSNLLSIILYSDATTTDTLGKSSLHPIYISIGNISTKRYFKKLIRLTFNNSMKFLLDPLFAEKGIDLEVDNKTFWFFPHISTIICDWPEAATFSLVYKSTNSNFPCHFCLISKTLLADTDLSDVTFRNNENMQEYFYNNAGQDVSLENIPNYFWSLSSINVYSVTVPDRMHHLNLGLFHYQIEFTQALLQKQDSSLVNKIDNRLSKISRFQKFQMFTNGLQSISRMTAKEYRILMKVMVFVVDNLYKKNENNVENFVENKKLSEVYAKWNKMYMMSRSEIFTESDLENFRKDTFEWAKLFVEIFKPYSRSKLKFSKFHLWIYHIFELIRQFDPLFAEKGIDLEVDNKTFWFFPHISTIICDWPEAATFSLVYKSTNSNFPCHFCLISKTLLADTDLSDVTFRNNENMQEYFYNNAGQDVSLENIPNYFWSLSSINVYSVTVPDRMHHLNLGLFHYQIEFTQALLQKQDSSLVNKIDNRLSKISRFQKFQMFTNGLQSISRMTAKEYRILMKVMVFVVDNLYKKNENNVENFVENKKLSEVYAKWNKMYMMSRSEIFTESDLENFRKDTFEWAKLFVEIFKPYSRSKLKFSKFHLWIYHIFELIRQFGIINGYTTKTYESLHKDFVKIPYRMSNKKNVEDQIMKTLKRQDIINVINKKQKKKKPTKLLNFSSKLFETKLTEANIYFCEKMNDPNINDNIIKGFNQFLECFNDFLDNILKVKNIKECDIIIYDTATLENESIIRAKNKFHDKPWFSNVAISMNSNESSDYQSDEGLCYGKILLMAKIEIEEKPSLNLALV